MQKLAPFVDEKGASDVVAVVFVLHGFDTLSLILDMMLLKWLQLQHSQVVMEVPLYFGVVPPLWRIQVQ